MIDLYSFIEALNEVSSPKDIINPSASGMHTEVILQTWKVKKGQRFCTNFVLGEMGAGLPHSIGACLATGRRVIHVEGDGGFQLNIQELETIRRLNLPIIMFIINNNGYGSIRRSQMKNFGRLTGADDTSGFTTPDLLELSDGYDLPYWKIDEDIERLTEVFWHWDYWDERDGKFDLSRLSPPCICEVMVNPSQQYRDRTERKLVDGVWIDAN